VVYPQRSTNCTAILELALKGTVSFGGNVGIKNTNKMLLYCKLRVNGKNATWLTLAVTKVEVEFSQQCPLNEKDSCGAPCSPLGSLRFPAGGERCALRYAPTSPKQKDLTSFGAEVAISAKAVMTHLDGVVPSSC